MNEQGYPLHASGYKLMHPIGSGTLSNIVWQAVIPSRDSQEVAIKIVELEEHSRDRLDDMRKEVQMLSQSRHENIVEYYCSFVEDTRLWLVMKRLVASCLDILKDKHASGIEDEMLIRVILRGALRGLAYLHSQHQLHRDIKSANILLSEGGQVQLTDFGVSTALDEYHKKRTTFVGTVCYMAPEVLDPSETNGYDTKADSWSLGITAIELAYGRPPYALNQPMKVIMMLIKHPSPSLLVPEHEFKNLQKSSAQKFSPEFRNFVDQCLQKDPHKRPTAKQLLKHPFMSKIPDADAACTYLSKQLLLTDYKKRKISIPSNRFVQSRKHARTSDRVSSRKEEEDVEWDFE